MPEDDKSQRNKPAQSSVNDLGPTANERSLNIVYSQCLSSYQHFLIKCSQHNDSKSNDALEKCFEEYSRLKIWGYQRKASLGLSVPGSLASTLIDYPDLENIVFEIYEQIIQSFDRRTYMDDTVKTIANLLVSSFPSESLKETLRRLTMEASAENDLETQSHITGNSSYDEEDSGAGIEIVECIFEGIEELYRLNNLISRPRLTGRYLRSTRSDILQASSEEIQHIREKFHLWQNDMVARQSEEKLEEIATPDFIAKRESTEKINKPSELALLRRLAVANMKRRRQLSYWDVHPYQMDSDSPMGATGSPPTAVTFSTVAKSAIISDQPDLHQNEDIITKYESSLVGASSSLRVPDLPLLEDTASTLECPYCHMTLDVEKMKHRANWKRHVFRDLRPYVCTFSDCTDPERLFTTRRDWVYHEMQLHRRGWICQRCGCHYGSKTEMAHHIGRVHNPNIKDHELDALLDMSERPIDESRHDRCPFCYDTMSTKKLLGHMACHMEELALFSLPHYHVEEIEAEENLSYIDAAPRSYADPQQTPSASYHSHSSSSVRTQAEPELLTNEGEGTELSGGVLEAKPQYSDGGLGVDFFCCSCGHGPWYGVIDTYCHDCQHRRCTSCPMPSGKE